MRDLGGIDVMSNKIFFFTGSGNSLAIARSLAEGIGDTEILSVAKNLGGFQGTAEERVGREFLDLQELS